MESLSLTSPTPAQISFYVLCLSSSIISDTQRAKPMRVVISLNNILLKSKPRALTVGKTNVNDGRSRSTQGFNPLREWPAVKGHPLAHPHPPTRPLQHLRVLPVGLAPRARQARRGRHALPPLTSRRHAQPLAARASPGRTRGGSEAKRERDEARNGRAAKRTPNSASTGLKRCGCALRDSAFAWNRCCLPLYIAKVKG